MIAARKSLLVLTAVQLISYPILVWLVWFWLGISERSGFQFTASVALALVMIAALAGLVALAFQGSVRILKSITRAALFVVASLVIIAVAWWASGFAPRATDWFALQFSKIRGSAVNPLSVVRIYPALLWTTSIVAIAVLLPPLVLRSLRPLREWRYWVGLLGVSVAGLWLPWQIVSWVPPARTLATQAVSMGLRWFLAYVIALASLLAFAFLARRLAQPPAADRPVPIATT